MMKYFLLLLALGLSACSTVVTHVKGFSVADFNSNDLQGMTYVFMDAEDSLEYKTYKNLIQEKLDVLGMIEDTSYKKDPDPRPNYIIYFTYSSSDPETYTYSSSVYGQTGGGSQTTYGSIYGGGSNTPFSATTYSTPTYGVVGTQTNSHTFNVKGMKFVIIDFRTTNSDKKSVYDGWVSTTDGDFSFSSVSKCIINALFKDFPTPNGKKIRYKNPESECKL